jgi:hypothetical protein
MSFSEIDATNLESVGGKKRKAKSRFRYPTEFVKAGQKRENPRKKRSMPKKSVIKG